MKKLILFVFIIISTFSYSQVQIGSNISGIDYSTQDFGYSVSLSADGSIIVIGDPEHDFNTQNSGFVQVYENIGGTWTQIGLNIYGNVGDAFGTSVDISSDGNIIAVGAAEGNVTNSTGYIEVYENIGGVWTQVGSRINGGLNDRSGWSISMSSDGSIVAMGSIWNDDNGNNSGQVQVYENIGDVWTQKGNNIKGSNSGDQFGFSVSLSSDGSIVAIGADRNDDVAQDSGQVQVYQNIGGVWTQIGDNLNGEGNIDPGTERFGFSVSLSSDGSILAIGAPGNEGNGFFSGNVRIYENIGGIWTQIGFDIDGESQMDQSGWSVSLSSDGSIVAIGANKNDPILYHDVTGHVRIYKNIGGVWMQVGSDIDGQSLGDLFGSSVSLSSDGSIVGIGAINAITYGQVSIYNLSSVLSNQNISTNKFNLYPNPTIDQFTIQLQEGIQLKKVSIYNQLGQFISSTKTNYMDTKNLSQGIYFVEVITNKGKSTKKLIIE